MIRVYYLKTDRIDGTDVVRGSGFMRLGILGIEGKLRKLIQDTTGDEHKGLAAEAESWREATIEEAAFYAAGKPSETEPGATLEQIVTRLESIESRIDGLELRH